MRCDPKAIVRSSDMRNVLNYKDGDTDDIVSAILKMDKQADRYIDKEAAKCLIGGDGYETLRNVWRFVKSNVRYKTDRPGKEIVKSPAALFKIGHGDCKSFSISEAAILRALGFTGIRYRFAAYKNGPVSHVYIVCKLKGKDVILDAVYGMFDAEDAYTYKKDIPAAKTNIAGIGAASKPQKISTTKILGLALIVAAFIRYDRN